MQTKWESFIESCANVLIGIAFGLATQLIVFPWFDIKINIFDNLLISVIFTVTSLIRSFLVRRYYNWKHIKERK